MQIDLTTCFTDEELPLATRIFAARAKRLNQPTAQLLRAAIRDQVFDEAGRPDELTVSVVEASETRADVAEMANETTAAQLAAETAILPIANQEPTA